MISETRNAFAKNCRKCNVPSCDLTVDEQLVPCKTRCPFVQHMPNKFDKFGIKIWLLADVRSKYLCYGKPYLGKDSVKSKEINLPADVCLKLMRPYFKKGYKRASHRSRFHQRCRCVGGYDYVMVFTPKKCGLAVTERK